MRPSRTTALLILVCALSTFAQAQSKRLVIAASVIFDGRGNILRDTRFAVEGGKIVAIDPKLTPVNIDLRGLTVMPGWIDAHVHLTWSFGKDGKNIGGDQTTQDAAYASASNAWATLMAGFTTVQNLGGPTGVALRDAISSGTLPGPRMLTSIEPIMGRGEATGTPEELRAAVRKQKQAGADVIKIFASGGMTEGKMTLSPEQLQAACDEANKQGLRAMVHAYRDAVHEAILAGCTQIEHGLGASDDDLKLMARNGIYFDPQSGMPLKSYIRFKDQYAGTPYFTNTKFDALPQLLPLHFDVLRRAAKTPDLKIVFGSDAVAGAHGRNAEEFVSRVRDAGFDAMSAFVSANSLAAEAIKMGNRIGSIATGYEADIIALDGDPLKDITAVYRIAFVMKGGVTYKNGMN